MKSTDIEKLQQCLKEDIEVACEDFEEKTGNRIKSVSITRITFNVPLGNKDYEYVATVEVEK